jgi:hypothetical protein
LYQRNDEDVGDTGCRGCAAMTTASRLRAPGRSSTRGFGITY